MSKDDMKSNVLRRYKLRVQDLAGALSRSQDEVGDCRSKIQELEMLLQKESTAGKSPSLEKSLRQENVRMKNEIARMETEMEIERCAFIANPRPKTLC